MKRNCHPVFTHCLKDFWCVLFVFASTECPNTEDVEDEDEEYDEDGDECVPVENESYVNFRKKIGKNAAIRDEEVLQENKKLCREFKRKPVTQLCKYLSSITLCLLRVPEAVYITLPCVSFSLPGAMAPCSSRGTSCLCGNRKRTFWTLWRGVRF